MRIGILTGRGDVPGLNACIRSVVMNADDRGWRVTGFRRGWAGVLGCDPADAASVAANTVELTRMGVRGLDRLGGTVLHTSRLDPRTVAGGDRTADVLAAIEALGVGAMIVLGGDGTLRFAAHLAGLGVPVISIPKTMDNDVHGTDYCIGFSTAISRSVEAITALRTTVASHERVGVVELFGRRSGETGLIAGFLAQVDRTMIAECAIDPARLMPLVERDLGDNPEHYAIMVVSEGARLSDEPAPDLARPGSARAEGVGRRLARAIEAATGRGTIVQELAYLMRSGAPDALDRMVGLAFGAMAVQLIEAGETGRMLAVADGRYSHVPAATLLEATRGVDVARLYCAATYRARLDAVAGLPMFLS